MVLPAAPANGIVPVAGDVGGVAAPATTKPTRNGPLKKVIPADWGRLNCITRKPPTADAQMSEFVNVTDATPVLATPVTDGGVRSASVNVVGAAAIVVLPAEILALLQATYQPIPERLMVLPRESVFGTLAAYVAQAARWAAVSVFDHACESAARPFRTTCWRGVLGFVGMARRRKYWPPLFRDAVAPPMEPLAVAAIADVYFTCSYLS
jgi:hypothetical protein